MAENDSTVEYRDIQGFPGYRVGSDGSVFSCLAGGRYHRLTENWHRLKPIRHANGYLFVGIYAEASNAVIRSVHTLVLEAFVGPRLPGQVSRHFPDRDPSNNRLENLQWASQKENLADREIHGTKIQGERHHNSKLTEAEVVSIRADRAAGRASVKELAERHHISLGIAYGIIARKSWKHVP